LYHGITIARISTLLSISNQLLDWFNYWKWVFQLSDACYTEETGYILCIFVDRMAAVLLSPLLVITTVLAQLIITLGLLILWL